MSVTSHVHEIKELLKLNAFVQTMAEHAREHPKAAYTHVFSPHIKGRIMEILPDFTWADYGGDYDDSVRAFASELAEVCAGHKALLDAWEQR